MKYLLDTCVVSEVIKKVPNKKVITWLQKQDEDTLYLSVLTIGEIEKGTEKIKDKHRKKQLKRWLENDLKDRFAGRLLPIDLDVAIKWGEVQASAELNGKMMPAIDGLIAVTALVNNCIMVSRNTKDMEQSNAELFNPWV